MTPSLPVRPHDVYFDAGPMPSRAAPSRAARPRASLACAGLLVALAPLPALAERFELDPAHTTVAFLIEHVGYAKTLGQFTEVEGGFDWDEAGGELSDVRIVVGTASVNTHHEKRDEHVRSDDFLNVEQYPEMVFTADGASIDGEAGSIDGELELLGQTHPLTLEVTLNKSDTYPFGHERYTLGVSARGDVERSEYGMDYGVANGLVGDTVELILETEALREE